MNEPTPANKDWVRELVDILAQLRAPDGCPWDREQTHASLKQWLVEESGELLDAIEDGNDDGMKEELGDLLLQIVFHCQIAREQNRFDLQDAARVCCEKMIRRHPHVFGNTTAGTAAAVLAQWEQIKKEEKKTDTGVKSRLSGVPRHLPALHRAHKIQKKAAKAGFDWPDVNGILAKIEEELREVREALAAGDETAVRAEIGDLLFSVVNLSRYRDHLAEDLLDETIRKFERRFQHMEQVLASQGKPLENCSLTELEALWQQSKAGDRS